MLPTDQPEKSQRVNRWAVVAPFFNRSDPARWIDDFVPSEEWDFDKVSLTVRDDWHTRSNRVTGFSKWREYWEQSKRAFPAAGIVTVFPQPAFAVALQKFIRRSDLPVIAWCFNLGEYPDGIKRAVARMAFKSVDHFVVHSKGEIPRVAQFLDRSEESIEFVHLQRAPIPIVAQEDDQHPFIVSMGSANRDYTTFLRAAEISGLPSTVVASPRSLEGLTVPSNVSVFSGLSATACHELVQRSRFSVVPLANPDIASGQVTVIESMRMNRPVVATESIGTVDYIENLRTGVLVPPHDAPALATAMLRLWDDRELRKCLAEKASKFADEFLSDKAAGSALADIIRKVQRTR